MDWETVENDYIFPDENPATDVWKFKKCVYIICLLYQWFFFAFIHRYLPCSSFITKNPINITIMWRRNIQLQIFLSDGSNNFFINQKFQTTIYPFICVYDTYYAHTSTTTSIPVTLWKVDGGASIMPKPALIATRRGVTTYTSTQHTPFAVVGHHDAHAQQHHGQHCDTVLGNHDESWVCYYGWSICELELFKEGIMGKMRTVSLLYS